MELMSLSALLVLATLLLGAGGAVALAVLACAQWEPLSARIRAYEAKVARELLFLRLDLSARQWLYAQLAGVVSVVACLVLRLWIPAGLLSILGGWRLLTAATGRPALPAAE